MNFLSLEQGTPSLWWLSPLLSVCQEGLIHSVVLGLGHSLGFKWQEIEVSGQKLFEPSGELLSGLRQFLRWLDPAIGSIGSLKSARGLGGSLSSQLSPGLFHFILQRVVVLFQ